MSSSDHNDRQAEGASSPLDRAAEALFARHHAELVGGELRVLAARVLDASGYPAEVQRLRDERDQAHELLRLYVPHGKPPCQFPAQDGSRCCECLACHAYSILPAALIDAVFSSSGESES